MVLYDWTSWFQVNPSTAIRIERKDDASPWRTILRTEDRDGYVDCTGVSGALVLFEREALMRNRAAGEKS